MEWAGTIYTILPFEANIGIGVKHGAVVYGYGGITFMYEASVDPTAIATYGYQTLDWVGVPKQQVVIDANGTHIFVGNDGRVKALQRDLTIKPIGYDEYVNKDTVKLSFNRRNNQVVLAHTTGSVVIGEVGTGRSSVNLESVVYDKREGLVVHSPTAFSITDAEFIIDKTNFGWNGH